MTTSEIISSLALLVSLGSFSVSLYVARRDRVALTAEAKFYYPSERSAPSVGIVIANAGRRAVGLQMLVALTETDAWYGVGLGRQGEALILVEGQSHEVVWKKENLTKGPTDEDWLFVDLEVEDTLGKRHPVRNAKPSLRLLLNS